MSDMVLFLNHLEYGSLGAKEQSTSLTTKERVRTVATATAVAEIT